MRIEQDGGYRAALTLLIRALGHLGDADDDEPVPMSKASLADWWSRRQARVVANRGR